ncbi:ATP-binding protein [Paenibacillus sp. ClWae2A]|uniref:ATP-binding protein n=1 Tax=Paenibacillus sp. ClWae2A TaxID=3057177 RepID=UPI0028F4E7A3|nr:ATP-binding protein [Paenibacillus sp. ClWae2A]MDT9721994.1 ATP-binding protein [Paenibacillus sp. ClWae2A]
MKKHIPYLYFIIPIVLFFLILTVLILFQLPPSPNKQEVQDGHLSLTDKSLITDEGSQLDGVWAFYWEQLLEPKDFASGHTGPVSYVNVPESWGNYEINGRKLGNTGFATYRLVVDLPEQDIELGLLTSGITSAHRLWINGKLVSESGIVGRTLKESSSYKVPALIRMEAGQTQADIIIQVSNYTHRKAGLFGSLTIGEYNQLNQSMKYKLVSESMIIGCMLIMGLYHILLYTLLRKNRESLYFGLICILLAMKNSSDSQYILSELIPGMSGDTFLKIEYLGFLGSSPLALLFCYSIFPNEMSKRLRDIFWIPGLLFTLFILFTPAQVYTKFALFMQAYAILIGFVIIQYVVRAAMKNVAGARWMLAGTVVFFITVVNDILMNNGMIRTGIYFSYGLLFLILCLSIVVSTRFSNAMKTNERLSSRLLDLDRVKDEFLANTSHELRTPLNGIIGLTQSLLYSMNDRLEDSQRMHLNMIVSSGQRMSFLINDILDYALLKNNDMRLHRTQINLHQLVEVVLTVVKPLITGRDLILHNRIDPHFPPIEADENRMQQILFNLIGNAIKYTPSGYIVIRAQVVQGDVEIQVEDTGIGIPEDKFAIIFNPFEKLESIDNTGTGLGLKITKQLVELHGGVIKVQSKVNQGSLFSFTVGQHKKKNASSALPDKQNNEFIQNGVNTFSSVTEVKIASSHHVNVEVSSEKESELQPYHVLIVDDEPVNLQVVIQQLAPLACVFEIANSGTEALARLNELQDIDLVITDMMMVGMSGYELCGLIRERYSLIELPILIMTASNRDDTITACFAAGANDYISKPIGRNELISRVRTLLLLKRSAQELSLNAQELAELNQQLSELNINLEHRIQDRTVELEQKNKDLGRLELSRRRLLSDISHELRTPMTAIQGYVEAIVSGLVDNEEDQKVYLQMVLVKALGLNRLIHDLFELSRLESGKTEMILIMMSLQELMDTIQDKFRLDITRADLSYEFQVNIPTAQRRDYQVVIDMDRITQVLTNLVFNAIQHTGADGMIRLHCSIEEWESDGDSPGQLTIRVEDTGAGIMEESLPFVFDRFFREKHDRHVVQGSGIGLAIAKEIIQYHDGNIYVESAVGKGSSFYFTLPLYVLD